MKIKLFTLPNILTLANLACGCMAVVYALGWFDPKVFFWLIAAAAAFDFLDGMAARLTGQYSEVGKQLDSLADVVSFGVAPSAMLFTLWQLSSPAWHNLMSAEAHNVLGVIVFTVALFSALRLAKFNVDETQKEEFTGLPTPAAGLAIAALPVLCPDLSWTGGAVPREALLAVAAVVSWLLISPLRMFSLKFKSWGWRENRLRYTFLASSAVLIAVFGIGGIACAVALYIVMSAVRHLAGMRQTEEK